MAIMMPEKKPGLLSKIAGPAGSIIGGAAGFVGSGFNPAGAALGASLGGGAGSVIGGVANKDAGQAIGGAAQGVAGAASSASDDALARRLEEAKVHPVLAAPSTGDAMQRRYKLGNFNFYGND